MTCKICFEDADKRPVPLSGEYHDAVIAGIAILNFQVRKGKERKKKTTRLGVGRCKETDRKANIDWSRERPYIASKKDLEDLATT